MEYRNIGIFAHVDTGKTTLSECILVHAGIIRQAGSVDNGTAHTDTLPVEQRRGISVKATSVTFNWKGIQFNLIDTPGHTDFSAEIERSLWALDGAILLLDAVEGVQPQTEVLFSVLQRQKIPTILFINKIDRDGADLAAVMKQIHTMLTQDAVLLSDEEALTEFICSSDDTLLADYLEGKAISSESIRKQMQTLTRQRKCYPVIAGSAMRDQGVETLLNAVVDYLPAPVSTGPDLCGIVFSCLNDRVMGRGLLVRLYGGRLENRMSLEISLGMDFMTQHEKTESRKITQIRDVAGNDLGALEAGMVGVVYGLGDLDIGYLFGNRELLPRPMEAGTLRKPLINVQVMPDNPEDMNALRKACETLSAEDPMLHAKYIRTLDQLQLQTMGTVQLEILEEMLRTRFNLNASFGQPSVIYKETIRNATRGFISYTMPKPCWAVLDFLIEPAPRGSGVTFESKVPVKDIMARYQHQVQQTIPMALRQGRLGWEVTDVKITLIGGEHHLEHTHPLDFIVATPMGIQNGLANAENVLLEPILEAKFLLPSDAIGRIISDVNTMRGEVLETSTSGERVSMTALLPVGTSLDYPTKLAMVTGGRGFMNVRLHSYRECPLELGATSPRRSVDPLDTAKYILTIRNALAGSLFDDE